MGEGLLLRVLDKGLRILALGQGLRVLGEGLRVFVLDEFVIHNRIQA